MAARTDFYTEESISHHIIPPHIPQKLYIKNYKNVKGKGEEVSVRHTIQEYWGVKIKLHAF
jgi:hypothetical protein